MNMTFDASIHCGFNGVDGATTTNDESSLAHTMSFVGNAQLDTAQFKFGVSSLYTDGATDRVTTPDSADWNFGSGPFTAELWIRFDGTPTTNAGVMGQWDGLAASSGFAIFKQGANLFGGFYDTGGTFRGVSAAWSPSANTWYHLCLERNGSNLMRLYVDGSVLASGTFSQTERNSTAVMGVGAIGQATYDFKGWTDEVRFTNGVARYDGAFTPPTSAFPRS